MQFLVFYTLALFILLGWLSGSVHACGIAGCVAWLWALTHASNSAVRRSMQAEADLAALRRSRQAAQPPQVSP